MLTMTDAMRQINGIRVMPASTANSNFYSRGYQLTTSVDGTPNASGTLNNASFDLSMYDRIEMLRGSSGLLQGAGGAGGVVNEVTKKPGQDFALTLQLHFVLSSESMGNHDSGYDEWRYVC
ncbi:TonB-dependent receptor plug domain-containing protein [Acetobacter sp. AC2005]|uniref:TonB-dependent receptor plug domain-containing protein n=1 Tax=Acetobacter sp. AC2005 TaxID=3134142 RepID=UPI0030CEB865